MGLMPLRRSLQGGRPLGSALGLSLGGSVPAPMAVCLCLACFLVGFVSHPSAPALPPLASEPQQVGTSAPRKLQAQAGDSPQAQHIAAQPPRLAGDDAQQLQLQQQQQQQQAGAPQPQAQLPQQQAGTELRDYDAAAQEFLERSGLLALRPPLPPAASGNHQYTVATYQILSWHPRILVFPNFIDRARADHIIQLASRRIAPSGLSWRPNEKENPGQKIRTSSGVFLGSEDDPDGVLRWVEEKIANVTLIPQSHCESFNVLRYELDQKYDSHMDTFDPKDFGPQYSQRMATMLLYLSDVEEGGETVFKREGLDGAHRPVTDWASCGDSEYKYKPRFGDAVLFFSLDHDLKINPRALHGGCAVHKGQKWVATKWMHEKPLSRGTA